MMFQIRTRRPIRAASLQTYKTDRLERAQDLKPVSFTLLWFSIVFYPGFFSYSVCFQRHGKYVTESMSYLKAKGLSTIWQVTEVAKYGNLVYEAVREEPNNNIRQRDVFILKYPNRVSFLGFFLLRWSS